MKLELLDILSKNTLVSNLMKISPVGAELLHAVGRTNMAELIVAFRDFANAPKNGFDKEINTSAGCVQAYWLQ
jgi:hypothetical protein